MRDADPALATLETRAGNDWEESEQRTRRQTERSSADQHATHDRCFASITQARQDGVGNPSSFDILKVGTLPSIQKKNNPEKRSRIQQESNTGARNRDHDPTKRGAHGASHIETNRVQRHCRRVLPGRNDFWRDRLPCGIVHDRAQSKDEGEQQNHPRGHEVLEREKAEQDAREQESRDKVARENAEAAAALKQELIAKDLAPLRSRYHQLLSQVENWGREDKRITEEEA